MAVLPPKLDQSKQTKAQQERRRLSVAHLDSSFQRRPTKLATLAVVIGCIPCVAIERVPGCEPFRVSFHFWTRLLDERERCLEKVLVGQTNLQSEEVSSKSGPWTNQERVAGLQNRKLVNYDLQQNAERMAHHCRGEGSVSKSLAHTEL